MEAISKNRRLTFILLTATTILLLPLIAMQFSSQVNWDATDFIVAAFLLFGTGLLIELVLRKVRTFRIAAVIAILVILFVVWAELGVGIFGTPFAGS